MSEPINQTVKDPTSPAPLIPEENAMPSPSSVNNNPVSQGSPQTASINVQNTPEVSTANIPPMPANSVAPLSVTIESKKGSRGFGLFVIIGIAVIIIVYTALALIYFQNKKLASQTPGSQTSQNSIQKPLPTPIFLSENVIIENGNIAYREGSGSKILISKEQYTSTGITGFAKVSVSPDKSKMCFESWPPAPQPALFYSKVDGTEISQVKANSKNCLWTSDSQKIIYVNSPSGQNLSNIFIYDLNTKTEKNISQSSDTTKARNYEVVGLSADDSKVICKYKEITSSLEGQCEIDLNTFELISI